VPDALCAGGFARPRSLCSLPGCPKPWWVSRDAVMAIIATCFSTDLIGTNLMLGRTHCLADPLGVGRIVLVGLDEGADVLRDQPDVVAKAAKFARIMRSWKTLLAISRPITAGLGMSPSWVADAILGGLARRHAAPHRRPSGIPARRTAPWHWKRTAAQAAAA
jgi:hypothetical protein